MSEQQNELIVNEPMIQIVNEPLIHRAMVAIMRDTEAIGKDMQNQAQNFRFRGIDQVYNELHPVFARHGVYLRPKVTEHTYFEQQTKSGGQALHHFLKITFIFTAADGSSCEMDAIGEAADSGDKGLNKCMSAALKYALFQSLLIPTKDDKDPDADSIPYAGRTKRVPPPRYTPEQQAVIDARLKQGTVPEQPPPAKKSNEYDMLAAFREMKKAIGDQEYYAILGFNGYEKSNEIPNKVEGKRIYLQMAERKKEIDSAKEFVTEEREEEEEANANI